MNRLARISSHKSIRISSLTHFILTLPDFCMCFVCSCTYWQCDSEERTFEAAARSWDTREKKIALCIFIHLPTLRMFVSVSKKFSFPSSFSGISASAPSDWSLKFESTVICSYYTFSFFFICHDFSLEFKWLMWVEWESRLYCQNLDIYLIRLSSCPIIFGL